MSTAWFETTELVVYRAVPSTGDTNPKIKDAGVGGVITFGVKGKASVKIPKLTPFKDPYYSERIGKAGDEPSIFGDKVNVSKIGQYNPAKPLNNIDGLHIWNIYRLRDVKRLLSAYMGCPITHILFGFDGDDEATTLSEALLSISTVTGGGPLWVYLLGDWPNHKTLDIWASSESEWTNTSSLAERANTLRLFSRREELFQTLEEYTYKMSGSVSQTILSSRPEKKPIINGEKLFLLTPLDDLKPEMLGKTQEGSWLIGLGNAPRGSEKSSIKILKTSNILPVQLQPEKGGETTALLLVKNTDIGVHPYRISILDDFQISIISNWTLDRGKSNRDTFLRNTLGALVLFLRRVYAHLDDDIMNPAYSLPDRKRFSSTISISSYREEYSGGSFDKFKSIISKLAQAEMVHITYITATSIYFRGLKGSSKDRVLELHNYIRGRLKTSFRRLSCVWCVPELASDIMSFLSKGPEVQIKAEEKDIFVTISNCNGDEEIQTMSEYVGRMAKYANYKQSAEDGKRIRDYANLNLLEQIDPILFGSRPMPGGKKINFSRECQGASRHPVPVSIDEATRSGKSAIVITNFTYGGPQAYKCVHKDFPFVSLRPKPFGTDCTMCCVQQEIPDNSLKAGEQSMCLRTMTSDWSTEQYLSPAISLETILTAKPLQFNGQQLPEGRLALFPVGVRELLPTNVYLYNPPNVDCQNIHEVVQWLISGTASGMEQAPSVTRTAGTPCQSCMGATLEDRLIDYIAFGAPLFAIRMMPTSSKSWRASFLDVGDLLEQSPYVMATWTLSPNSPAVSFYPVVSKDGRPAILEDLGLRVERGMTKGSALLFTNDAIVNKLGYTVTSMLLFTGICQGLMVSLPGSKNPPFFLQVKPTRAKIEKVSKLRDLTFPTVHDLEELFKRASKKLPYYSPIAKKIFYSKGKCVGMVVGPDNVTIMVQPSSALPRGIDTSRATSCELTQQHIDMLWGKLSHMDIPPTLVDGDFSKGTISACEIYLSNKLVRYGVTRMAVDILEKGIKKHSSSIEEIADLRRLFEKECLSFVTIGSSVRISMHGEGIVMLGEKITITKELFDAVVWRLATNCPKNPVFLEPYFQCFGSTVHREKATLEPWEKMVQ
jgi:hypothetical protein